MLLNIGRSKSGGYASSLSRTNANLLFSTPHMRILIASSSPSSHVVYCILDIFVPPSHETLLSQPDDASGALSPRPKLIENQQGFAQMAKYEI